MALIGCRRPNYRTPLLTGEVLTPCSEVLTMNCSINGCEKPSWARGWCAMHWTRWRRHGSPFIVHNNVGDAWLTCTQGDCHRPATDREWCHGHYEYHRRRF